MTHLWPRTLFAASVFNHSHITKSIMIIDNPLLARTPAPKPLESLYGYVLRVSQANGYESPWHIFRYAGLQQSKLLKTTTPAAPLAQVVGHPVEALQKLSRPRCSSGEAGNREDTEMPHMRRHLDITAPKICPKCIAEEGFIEAAWDLKIMLGCPVHGISLVTHCPGCGKPLTWFRPEMTVCRCGTKLATETHQTLQPRSRALLSIVRNALYGDLLPLADAMGMPQRELAGLHFIDLLAMLQRFRLFVTKRSVSSASISMMPYTFDELDAIASALENWPHGFHDMLRCVAPDAAGIAGALSVRQRFQRIYSNLLRQKSFNLGSLDFLRKAFVEFGISQGNGVYIDSRIRKRVGVDDKQIHVLNANALAKRFGIDPRTIQAVIDSGLAREISAQTVSGQTRTVYEVDEAVLTKDLQGGMGVRKAAAMLSMPVSVLTGLRKLGIYEVRHFARHIRSYHLKDLEHLQTKIVSPLPRISMGDGPDRVSLGKVFYMKFRSETGKARLVEAIIKGTIKPLGRIGSKISDVIICRTDLTSFLMTEAETMENLIPGSWVAKLLHCEVGAVGALLRTGHLKGTYRARYIRVQRDSLNQFANIYVSCAWVERTYGLTSKMTQMICREHGIELLWVAHGNAGQRQPFIERARLGLFNSEAPQHNSETTTPASHQSADIQMSPEELEV